MNTKKKNIMCFAFLIILSCNESPVADATVQTNSNTQTSPISEPTPEDPEDPNELINASTSVNSCSLEITSPTDTNVLGFNQSFSAKLQIANSDEVTPVFKTLPQITFDGGAQIPATLSETNTWTVDFNPYNDGTFIDAGVKMIQASITDDSGKIYSCDTQIVLSSETGSGVTPEEAGSCRFLDTGGDPIGPVINAKPPAVSFGWDALVILETDDNVRPIVHFTFMIEPFEFTPGEEFINMRDDGKGWMIRVRGSTDIQTIIKVDIGSTKNACTLTMNRF